VVVTVPTSSTQPVVEASAGASTPAAEAAAATAAILADLRGTHRGVVVDSPPGAGKSTLVVRAVRELTADPAARLIVVAQTNSQVDDLVDRIAEDQPELTVGRLHATDAAPPAELLAARPNLLPSTALKELQHLPVIVSTAAKWAYVSVEEPWPLAVVDEAYQMRSDALLAVAQLFERALFVGDPGQLDPFSVVETDRWAGLSHDPSASAVVTLLAHNPELPVHRLPVSWRLPASAAPLVSDAFYPFTPFRSGTGPGERRLSFAGPGDGSAAAEVVGVAAEHGWGLLELPAAHTVRTDPEAVEAVALVVRQLLDREGTTHSERGPAEGRPLAPERIAVGTAHRDQAAAVRAALARNGVEGVVADTANRLQGREFDVTVVLHPLSGRPDATAFHLETGRLCVLVSRHRHACVVVARAGIAELLDRYPSAEPVHLDVPVKFPDGWEANQSVLDRLEQVRVRGE
jgi:hypothetical protein